MKQKRVNRRGHKFNEKRTEVSCAEKWYNWYQGVICNKVLSGEHKFQSNIEVQSSSM